MTGWHVAVTEGGFRITLSTVIPVLSHMKRIIIFDMYVRCFEGLGSLVYLQPDGARMGFSRLLQ